MSTPKQRDEALAKTLRSEIYDSADRMAGTIFGGVPSDGVDLGRAGYLDYVRRNGSDPKFRQSLLTNVGAEAFRSTILEAYSLPEEAWPLPPGGPPTNG